MSHNVPMVALRRILKSLLTALVAGGLILMFSIALAAGPAGGEASRTPGVQASSTWDPVSNRLVRRLSRAGDSIDLADAALRLSPIAVPRAERREVLRRVDGIADRVRETTGKNVNARQTLDAINDVLFQQEGLRGSLREEPESLSLASLLERKRGSCVTLVALYLAVGDRLGISLSAVATPEHLFVRYSGPKGAVNVETLEEGEVVPDSTYRRRNRMAQGSIDRGIYLTALPRLAVVAYMLSNRGALASRMGDHRAALHELDAALSLDPDLPAAHYNRGIANLALKKYASAVADFTKAIDLNPLDGQALNNRGIAREMSGDGAAAREDFDAALRVNPAMKEARENLRHLDKEEGASPPE